MELVLVLAEPRVRGNVGVSARALKTMGFNCLWLVNPCNHLAEEALTLAHGSHDILEKARIFNFLEEVRTECVEKTE